jgi:CelD/BcsL family acetyltransferase involved in cellulose biosynthesis
VNSAPVGSRRRDIDAILSEGRRASRTLQRSVGWTSLAQQKYTTSALSWAEVERDGEILEIWLDLLRQRPPPNALQSSPDWAGHLATTGTSGVVVLVARDARGRVAGILPTVRHRYVLGHPIRSRVAPLARLLTGCVLGDVPLVSDDRALAAELIAGAFERLPDYSGIYFDALPIESHPFQLLDQPGSERAYLPYCLDAVANAHAVVLEGDFASYAERLATKLRYNVRRAIKKLEQTEGSVELVCFRSAAQVNDLIREATAVKLRSWQKRSFPEIGGRLPNYPQKLEDMARRGFLRSYVLRCGNTPCAFVIGYQGHGVYHYWEVGYDERFSIHSPGTVLLYLLLEDLFSTDRPRTFDFGRGDEAYKQRFATRITPVASWLLLRPTLANALRVKTHRLVKSSAARLSLALQTVRRASSRP